MTSNAALYALAAIGAVVTAYVMVRLVIPILLALVLAGFGRCADMVSAWAFRAGGGEANPHSDEESQHPRAPYDRIWAEALWIKRVCQYLFCRVGLSRWNMEWPERPDIERLHELREGVDDGE